MDDLIINNCVECGSQYAQKASKMASLCPECSHYLYGYENCTHKFENEKCIKCYWDGSRSDYIKKLIETNP